MSLKSSAFSDFRKKALVKRRERYLQKTNSQVVIISEIAAKLKETSLFSSKQISTFLTDSHRWKRKSSRATLVSGSKKRKLDAGAPHSQVEHQILEINRLKNEVNNL